MYSNSTSKSVYCLFDHRYIAHRVHPFSPSRGVRVATPSLSDQLPVVVQFLFRSLPSSRFVQSSAAGRTAGSASAKASARESRRSMVGLRGGNETPARVRPGPVSVLRADPPHGL